MKKGVRRAGHIAVGFAVGILAACITFVVVNKSLLALDPHCGPGQTGVACWVRPLADAFIASACALLACPLAAFFLSRYLERRSLRASQAGER